MQRPIRIFYVGTYERDYPRNAIIVAALRRAGFDVRELHEPLWAETSDKSALIGSPKDVLHLGARLVRAYARLLIHLLRDYRHVDVVVFGYIGQVDVLALGPFARLLRKPILFNPLVTLTDTLIEDRQRVAARGIMSWLIRQVDGLALKLSDTILVDTEANKDYLVSTFQLSAANILVLPVGADEAVFSPAMAWSNESSQPVDEEREMRVLFYGNMIPLQGVETIIRAAKLLEDDCVVQFEVIGTGQVHSLVRSLADQLGVRNVTFVSRVPYHDLPSRIEQADVVLGIFGGTAKAGRVVPNKVYQAMAMGAAIVTRDSPAVRDVLRDGESALLVPPEDPAAVARAIGRLADPSFRRRLGVAARARFAEVASLDVQAVHVTTAVDMVLGGSPAFHPEVTT